MEPHPAIMMKETQCHLKTIFHPPVASLYNDMPIVAPAVANPSFFPVFGNHLTLHNVFSVSECVATHIR